MSTNNQRSTKEILEEKYEDRGWYDYDRLEVKEIEKVEKLPFTFEEYKKISLALAEEAYEKNKPELYNTFFELQRRARYGNNYPDIEELSTVEEELWNMGIKANIEQVQAQNKSPLEEMIKDMEASVKPAQTENRSRGK